LGYNIFSTSSARLYIISFKQEDFFKKIDNLKFKQELYSA